MGEKTITGKTVHNLGAWTLKNYEMCLLGTRGAMLKYKKVNNIPQKVEALRRKHSQKPEKVRENIDNALNISSIQDNSFAIRHSFLLFLLDLFRHLSIDY